VEPYSSVVEQNITGLLCPNVTSAWVDAITSLINDPELRDTLAANAHARVSNLHSLNLTAAAWQDLFQGIDFPEGDPLYKDLSDNAVADHEHRTRSQLLRGTVRHLLQPESWRSAWDIYQNEGLAGLKKKWKVVF
jgi:hypothetical protein